MSDEANDEEPRAPLTIKSVRVSDRLEALRWATKEGVPMAELFGRMVRLWANQKSGSQPTMDFGRPPDPAPSVGSVSEAAEFLFQVSAIHEAAGIPVPASLAREARLTAKAMLRDLRGAATPPRRRLLTIGGEADQGQTETGNGQTLRLPHGKPN